MSMAPAGFESFSTLSPEQQSAFEKILPYLQSVLGGGDFEKFAAPLRREYNEQTIPGLAERFSGIGSQNSSAFRQALSSSAADFEERLGRLGAERENSAIQNILSALGINTQGLVEKQKPWWQEALIGASSGIGQSLGSFGLGSIGGGLKGAWNALSSLGGQQARSEPGVIARTRNQIPPQYLYPGMR